MSSDEARAKAALDSEWYENEMAVYREKCSKAAQYQPGQKQTNAASFEESKSLACEIVCNNETNAKAQYKFRTTSTGDTIYSLVYTTQIRKNTR
eukprot:scaffold18323_cov76-Skeletonema_dohrnii-CCMP3373.AAC.1